MTTAALAFSRSSVRSRRLQLDPVLLMAVVALLLLGVIMVASASITVAASTLDDPFFYVMRQLQAIALGVAAIVMLCAIPMSLWQRLAVPLMIVAFALLLAVLIPGVGRVVNGSRRWLAVINLQPSEIARVLLIVYLASYVVRRQMELREKFVGFIKPIAVLGAAAVLLLLEPDMGAATVLLATGMVLLFIAGAKWRHFLAVVGAGIGMFALLALASPYRLERLTSYWNPWSDPYGSGFQLTQSLIAIGRGEWFGVGLGASVQKLFYLPEAHTDFVFAVLAEELGIVGVVTMLTLVGIVVVRVLRIARQAAEAGMAFQAFVVAGFAIWFAMQTMVNVGVNMGLLPTKGLTLPFLSYGRSSMLATLGWLGLVLRTNHEVNLCGRSALPRGAKSKERES